MPRLDALKNRGFTLLEALVVLLILGIGLALATPSILSSIEKFRLEQAVVEVRGAFRQAQRQAISGGEACLIAIDLNTSRLSAPCISINERSLPEQIKVATNITLATADTEVAGRQPDRDNLSVAKINNQLNQPHNSYLIASTDLSNLDLASTISQFPGLRIGACLLRNVGKKNYYKCSHNGAEENSRPPKLAAVNFGILGTAEFSIVKPNFRTINPIDPTAKIIFYASESANSPKRCIAISNTLGLTRTGLYTGSIEPTSITNSGVCSANE